MRIQQGAGAVPKREETLVPKSRTFSDKFVPRKEDGIGPGQKFWELYREVPKRSVNLLTGMLPLRKNRTLFVAGKLSNSII